MTEYRSELWIDAAELGPQMSAIATFLAKDRDAALREANEWAQAQLEEIAGQATFKVLEDDRVIHEAELSGHRSRIEAPEAAAAEPAC